MFTMTESKEPQKEKVSRLLELIETNSTTLQKHLNEDSPKSITKQYKDLIRQYSQELAEVVGFKIQGKKLSSKEMVDLYFNEKKKIIEIQNQLQLQEERKRKDRELGRDNILLMLDVHRNFAKESLFGNFMNFKSEGFKEIQDSELIDFRAFSRFMMTDEVIMSYSSDTTVCDFRNNLIRRYEYHGKDLEWNISMIDIEILFNELREKMFIASDTPRNVFFDICNPHLPIFTEPIIWRDIKELVYFLDKCRDLEIIENTKYQSLIENHKMFKTQNSKGNYLKSNSIRTTLSDLKNGILETEKFKQRALLIDNLLENCTL